MADIKLQQLHLALAKARAESVAAQKAVSDAQVAIAAYTTLRQVEEAQAAVDASIAEASVSATQEPVQAPAQEQTETPTDEQPSDGGSI